MVEQIDQTVRQCNYLVWFEGNLHKSGVVVKGALYGSFLLFLLIHCIKLLSQWNVKIKSTFVCCARQQFSRDYWFAYVRYSPTLTGETWVIDWARYGPTPTCIRCVWIKSKLSTWNEQRIQEKSPAIYPVNEIINLHPFTFTAHIIWTESW